MLPTFFHVTGVDTEQYKINPQFVAAVYGKTLEKITVIVLSGGKQIETKLSIDEVMKLING